MQTAGDNVKLLSRPGSLIIIFDPDTQFQKEPHQRGRKIHGVGIFFLLDFRLKSQFISDTVRDRPNYGTLIVSHRWGGRYVSVPMTLSDP